MGGDPGSSSDNAPLVLRILFPLVLLITCLTANASALKADSAWSKHQIGLDKPKIENALLALRPTCTDRSCPDEVDV